MKKYQEEVQEYLEADNFEELADTMEVLYDLEGSLGYNEADLDAKRRAKKEERGGSRDWFWRGLIK